MSYADCNLDFSHVHSAPLFPPRARLLMLMLRPPVALVDRRFSENTCRRLKGDCEGGEGGMLGSQ
eukprot:1882-Eustigmatos_ZCMA.PRE.1